MSPADYLLRNRSRQCVDEQGKEERGDKQQQGQNDVFLVALPHQVEETLEWIDKPREGGVRTAAVGGRQRGAELFH